MNENADVEPDITLFGNRFSGHTYKVRLFLALNNISHKYQPIDLLQPRSERPEFFRKHSRYGEVPLLIIDEEAFVQSNAILLHLSKIFGVMHGNAASARVAEWLMWEQSRIGMSLPNLRFERKFKTNSDAAVQSWLAGRLQNDLDVLEAHLAKGDSFVVGERPTIADCAIAGYLYWLEDAGFSISNWPMVANWLERVSKLDGWQHPDVLIAQK